LALKQLALKLAGGGLQTSEHRFGDGLWAIRVTRRLFWLLRAPARD